MLWVGCHTTIIIRNPTVGIYMPDNSDYVKKPYFNEMTEFW